jgi:myo-inositol 2-dehydrogenase / D-chiro-inositol 1-dehydrogenase
VKYGVAVIGMGKISDVHITGWKLLEDAEVKVVVDVDAARAEHKAKTHNIPSYETDFNSVVQRPDIDIIDICLPHDLHAPYSIKALQAGKHVLVEKPIATKLADAESMIAAANKAGKKLMVAESLRYSGVYEHVSDLLAKKAIGEPFLFSTRCEYFVDLSRFQGPHTGWRSVPEKIGGGVLLESGIHNIANARYFMGEVDYVYALQGKQTRVELPVEDTVTLLMRFESGTTGQGTFTWGAKWSKTIIDSTVYGTEGILGLDLANRQTFLDNGKEREVWTSPTNEYGHENEIKHFLDCIKEDRTPITDGVEETKTLRLIMAAYQSIRENKPVRPDDVKS